MERTLIVLKPDAVERSLTGEIISRFENRGFHIIAAKLMTVPRAMAHEHYQEHRGKPFFESLCDFITSGPVLALVLEAEDAIKLSRTMIGATLPVDAVPGSIRGDLTLSHQKNLVHGSDKAASAQRELALWFPELAES